MTDKFERTNKIKEASSKNTILESEPTNSNKSLIQKKILSIDNLMLSSYYYDEEDDSLQITLLYNDTFLTTNIKDFVFKEYKLINKNNIVDIIYGKNLAIKGLLFYSIRFYLEKYMDNSVVYKMEILSSIVHNKMEISFNEILTLSFTKMTDSSSIMNERLKLVQNNNLRSYSIYDFFIA